MKILHLEDSPEDRELVQARITRAFPNCEITNVVSREELEGALREGEYDLVLSDYHVPGFNELDALQMVRSARADLPFIFCSGTIGEDRAIEAMRAGATDYVLKDRLERLGPAIERAVRENVDRKKRAEAEQAYKKSQETIQRLIALLQSTSDLVAITDGSGCLVYLNPAGRKLLEIGEESPSFSFNLFDFYPADVRDKMREDQIRTALAQGLWQGESQLIVEGEKRVSVSQVFVAHGTDEGGSDYFSTIVRDITAIKTAERRLREQNEILTRAHDSIIILDLNDRVKFWNHGAERVLGWKASEVLDRVPEGILESDTRDQKGQIIERLLHDGNWSGSLGLAHRDGRTVYVEAHASVVADENGQPQARLVMLTDVTEKKALEDQLFRAQRLESLGLLASGISHDLNNILAPILMAAPLLRKQESDAGHLKLIESLERSAERGADMVQQILAFARGANGEPQLIQLKHVLRDITKLVHSTFPKSIKLHEDFSEPWPVRANPTQMHQLLLNLCVNARDAMPQGGTLTLIAQNKIIDVSQATTIRGGRTGPHVVLAVTDTGTGIPPHVLERMWEPFFTTKGESKGTGLGLSTVRGIVQNHGGFIEVLSEVRKGTTFRIYLPADDAVIAETASRNPFEAPRGQNEVVLVVDDDATIRDLLAATLADHGYRVLVAADGTEAIEQASRAKDIACVITDFGMPEIDGMTLLRILKRLLPAAKLILASGDSEAAGLKKDGAEGIVSAFVVKPYRSEALLMLIHRVLSAV
jgi:two-component system cell cycle sensor histidine kinase/response regulator CckA